MLPRFKELAHVIVFYKNMGRIQVPIDQHGANMLFQVISSRYEHGSIILTSNKAVKDWGEIFNDITTQSLTAYFTIAKL